MDVESEITRLSDELFAVQMVVACLFYEMSPHPEQVSRAANKACGIIESLYADKTITVDHDRLQRQIDEVEKLCRLVLPPSAHIRRSDRP